MPEATAPARLTAISMRLDTMLQSVKTVSAALDDFYNSLSDEQKAQFNTIGRQQTALAPCSAQYGLRIEAGGTYGGEARSTFTHLGFARNA
jgi:hypothetical protein